MWEAVAGPVRPATLTVKFMLVPETVKLAVSVAVDVVAGTSLAPLIVALKTVAGSVVSPQAERNNRATPREPTRNALMTRSSLGSGDAFQASRTSSTEDACSEYYGASLRGAPGLL